MVLYSPVLTPLTDWPDTLEDVIDWFLRVGGKDEESQGHDRKSELSSAVKALGDYGEAQKILESASIAGLFNAVCDGLRVFIGYSGQRNMTANGIGNYHRPSYASSYEKSATWEGNWQAADTNSQTCAAIFLYTMPIVYFGLTYLFWRCGGRHGWQDQKLQGDVQGTQLHEFMNYMGYSSDNLSNTIKGQKIAELFGSENDSIQDFKTLYSSASLSYPDFLRKLQEHGQPKLRGRAMSAPLYALYAVSSKYLQSKVKHSKIMDLPQTQSNIAKTLKGYSEAVTKLGAAKAKDLSTAYNTLLTQIKSVFHPDPPSPASSSAGAVAGGVLGTAALGGTAAALATNVGGITTTLKSLIPIFK
ncbi:uncharacterized protein BcabD6B2_19970 [Babesia caballi]|uniref:Uncharacterized protein n=1 Tax=Babesia caballi TaxID=5871 RepID=A0AAV4LSF9_BABCB|nr:hypothetical protein, conserved [Babesia caballi]